MAVVNYIFFAALCTLAFAKVNIIHPCDDVPQDICGVTESRITPCRKPSRCVILKNTNVSISFDFTPNFSATKAKTMVYALIGNTYQPFVGFGADDACGYTGCPIEAGKSQTLNYNMFLTPKIPKGSFDLKWNVWNEDNDQETCCFKFAIRIR